MYAPLPHGRQWRKTPPATKIGGVFSFQKFQQLILAVTDDFAAGVPCNACVGFSDVWRQWRAGTRKRSEPLYPSVHKEEPKKREHKAEDRPDYPEIHTHSDSYKIILNGGDVAELSEVVGKQPGLGEVFAYGND